MKLWDITDTPWSWFPEENQESSFTDDPEVIKYFTLGQCNALAWEIHQRKKDLKLAILSDAPHHSVDYIGHVFVMTKDLSTAIDIRGIMSLEAMQDYWPNLGYFHVFKNRREFRLDMELWENKYHYARDPIAKRWADYIVGQL